MRTWVGIKPYSILTQFKRILTIWRYSLALAWCSRCVVVSTGDLSRSCIDWSTGVTLCRWYRCLIVAAFGVVITGRVLKSIHAINIFIWRLLLKSCWLHVACSHRAIRFRVILTDFNIFSSCDPSCLRQLFAYYLKHWKWKSLLSQKTETHSFHRCTIVLILYVYL